MTKEDKAKQKKTVITIHRFCVLFLSTFPSWVTRTSRAWQSILVPHGKQCLSIRPYLSDFSPKALFSMEWNFLCSEGKELWPQKLVEPRQRRRKDTEEGGEIEADSILFYVPNCKTKVCPLTLVSINYCKWGFWKEYGWCGDSQNKEMTSFSAGDPEMFMS